MGVVPSPPTWRKRPWPALPSPPPDVREPRHLPGLRAPLRSLRVTSRGPCASVSPPGRAVQRGAEAGPERGEADAAGVQGRVPAPGAEPQGAPAGAVLPVSMGGPRGPGTREGAGGAGGVDGGAVGGGRELVDVTSALGRTSLTFPVGQLREPRPVDRRR